MENTATTKRTLSQTATDIEKAVTEIYGLLSTEYEAYEIIKKEETAYLEMNRENINKLYSHQIDVAIKKGAQTPEGRAKVSRARLKLQKKLKAYDEDVKVQLRKLKRKYLTNCNIIIKRVCCKYDLTVKHVKRILGQNLNSEL